MKRGVKKSLVTLIAVPLQLLLSFMVIGSLQSEGVITSDGWKFPYGYLVLYLLVPLITVIWARHGSVARRAFAWLMGSAAVVVASLVVSQQPIAQGVYVAFNGDLDRIFPMLYVAMSANGT
jgi:hypothetical protein